MKPPISSRARWVAIESIHNTLKRLKPGSAAAEYHEHAITLALSPRRCDDNHVYLRRNAIRDARRIHYRRHQPPVLSEIATADGNRPDVIFTNKRQPEPHAQAIACELEDLIRNSIADVPHALECLDAMMNGELGVTTARRLGIPRHRINYLRIKIRSVTSRLLSEVN